jgi:hypothetical protein
MKTVFIVILAILALVVLFNLFKPSAPSAKFDGFCAPGYMPTGSGCVPTNEDIGVGPRP